MAFGPTPPASTGTSALFRAADITEESNEYEERLPQWRKVRDAIEGEDRVKERGTEYLPKPSGMKDARKYNAYKERASFYAATDRTRNGLEGLVFRVPATVEVPDGMEPLLDVASPRGVDLNTILHEAIREVVSLGRYGMLVDLPGTQVDGMTVPTISTYFAEDIIRWEEIFDDETRSRKLVRVVVREEPATASDETVERLLELFIDPADGIYTVQVWEKRTTEVDERKRTPRSDRQNEDQTSGEYQQVGEPIKPNLMGQTLDEIPFVFINTKDQRPRTERPPMLDLVNINLAHFRNSADYEHALFKTANPTHFIFGIPKEDVPTSVGGDTIWTSENAETNAGIIELSGDSLPQIRQAMLDKEDRMAALGALLIKEITPNITAETTRNQTAARTSTLINTVDSVTLGTTKAMKLAAAWMGLDPEEVNIELNRDYVDSALDAQDLASLVSSWQQGAYSKQTLHENLQRGEVIPTTRSLEEEQELMAEEEAAGIGPEPMAAPGGTPGAPGPGAPSLQAGGSIEAKGTTAPADGHVHVFQLVVADDGTITGRAINETPTGETLDHEHGISRLDTTEDANGHTHSLPLSGGSGPEPGPEPGPELEE